MLDAQKFAKLDQEQSDNQEPLKPIIHFKTNGYIQGIGWPPEYTEGQKGCFVADVMESIAEVLRKASKELDAAKTPEEYEERYNKVVSMMWAGYGLLDDFKFQINHFENVSKAGDQWDCGSRF